MSYKISIPDVLPSLNRQGHWRTAHRLKDRWKSDIFVLLGGSAVRHLRGLAQELTKMRVSVTVHNAREYDDDNKRWAEKIIYDALKRLEVIYDDRPAFVARELHWVKCSRAEKRTEIEIGPADA